MNVMTWIEIAGYISAGALLGVVLMGIIIWSIRRHHDPKLKIESAAPIDQLIHSLAGLTLSTVVPGNSVAVLENGAFFDVLIERIATAQQSVHFETFLWKDGVLGQRLANALCERARAGRQVRVLLDADRLQGGRRGRGAAHARCRLPSRVLPRMGHAQHLAC